MGIPRLVFCRTMGLLNREYQSRRLCRRAIHLMSQLLRAIYKQVMEFSHLEWTLMRLSNM